MNQSKIIAYLLVCIVALISLCVGIESGAQETARTEDSPISPPASFGETPQNGGTFGMQGRVRIQEGANQRFFTPGPNGPSGRHFGLLVAGNAAAYDFKGHIEGNNSTSIIRVEFFEGRSAQADAVTLSSPQGVATCGGLGLTACRGLSTRLSADRTILIFEFQGTRLQRLGQNQSQELRGELRVNFPRPIPYLKPTDLPTDIGSHLTLDGEGFEALLDRSTPISFQAAPVITHSRSYQLRPNNISLLESPPGSLAQMENQTFYCVTPSEPSATPCTGYSITSTETEQVYQFDGVSLKEFTREGRVGPLRRILRGTLRIPHRQATLARVGGQERLNCLNDSCQGVNQIGSGASGEVIHQISVSKKSSSGTQDGIQGISFTYDLFNPSRKSVTLVTGAGGMLICSSMEARPTGDCSGIQLESDGMTVALTNVRVQDYSGNSWQITGSFKAGR
jgi:hypothetical protein